MSGSFTGPTSGSAPWHATVGVSSPHEQKLARFREYFRPQFNSWAFDPIERLAPSQDALIGFIFMACAIDYLAGIWWDRSSKGQVEAAYTGFVNEYSPKGRYDPSGLDDSLRNGLIHMFTLKDKKYVLTHNNPRRHLKSDPFGQIILNAESFRDDLAEAKEQYFHYIEAKPDLLDNLLERYRRDGFLELSPLEIPGLSGT